jgi:hypothetical protein
MYLPRYARVNTGVASRREEAIQAFADWHIGQRSGGVDRRTP